MTKPGKIMKLEKKEKINQNLLPEQRIKNHNIVKRRRDNDLYESMNRNNYNKREIKINKEIRDRKERENTKKESFTNIKNRIFKNINIYDNKNDKNSMINLKYKRKISPFKSQISIKKNIKEENKINNDNNKENNKYYKINRTIEKTNFTNKFFKSIESMKDINENIISNPFKSTMHSKIINLKDNITSNSSNNRRKKETIINNDSKLSDTFRLSNKYIFDSSAKNSIKQFRNSSKYNNYNSNNNSSLGISLLGNNSLINSSKYYKKISSNNIIKNSFKNNNFSSNLRTNYNSINKEEKESNEIKKLNEFENKENEKEKTIKLFSEKSIKDNISIKKEEETIDNDEDYDKIEDIEELISRLKQKKKKLEKEEKIKEEKDKFNDSDLYESKEESSFGDENKDTVKDFFFNVNPKKNYRESLVLKSNFRRQSILISQEKLNNISNEIDFPTINESDYSYIKPIGEGTYGVVYLVENNKTSEQFALKKIICRDYNELIKQKNELKLLFSVRHEHILKLYGIQFKYLDETTSAIYILMELAQNDWNQEIKRRILAKKNYTEKEIINILKQIVEAFLFLQVKNIAHRDIKPQNILFFPNNIYKIADFGEAKFIKNIAEQSTLKGSELFMSPLLYKGYKFNQHNVLHNPFKSDMFSLGYCLLYAMCLNLKILNSIRELSSMKTVKSNIDKYMIHYKYSDKLMNIIYKMVDINEDKRYDFEDLSVELEKL